MQETYKCALLVLLTLIASTRPTNESSKVSINLPKKLANLSRETLSEQAIRVYSAASATPHRLLRRIVTVTLFTLKHSQGTLVMTPLGPTRTSWVLFMGLYSAGLSVILNLKPGPSRTFRVR